MNIDTRNNFNAFSFCAASDLTLSYVVKNRAKYLPERVLREAHTLAEKPVSEQPALKDLHNKIYSDLFSSKSLEEAKILYPEFTDIIDIQEFANSRSKAIKAIKEKMPLKDFTLQYLKDIFKLVSEDCIVEKYGFSNRSLVLWLNEKLHINKPSGSYNILVKMTDETENSRIAELSRRAVYNNYELHVEKSKKGAETQKRSEVREKKREMMLEYCKNHPEQGERTRLISKLTWERCAQIREALSRYTSEQNEGTRKILEKKVKGLPLTDNERRILNTYFKCFWNNNPELKEIYREERLKVIDELKKQGLVK